ncbi:MAG: SDR family oxidoreductase [Geitlerinemataceae cyanobacterium]
MKVAILGCGYVGKTVASYWSRERNLEVMATTTTPEKVPSIEAIPAEAMVLKGNDREGLKSFIRDREVLLVCLGSRKSSYAETYLETAQTLISVLKYNSSVRQVIYTGSYGLYGDREGEWVDETSPIDPVTSKEEILAQTEQVLLSVSTDDRRVCILRLGGIYGPDRELVKIFGRVAGKTLPGQGLEVGNWIHLEDIVRAIEFARQQQLQGVYNLVDDGRLTRRDLIDRILSKHKLPAVTWDESSETNRSINVKVSNQKLKNMGYSLVHPYFYDRDI